MITVQEAFAKFRSKMELTQGEQNDASRRQQEIREVMKGSFDVEDDFLTGSYKRWTKIKPLKDVDIFCVLGDDNRHYRDKKPSVLLSDVENVLANKYGNNNVSAQRRSCTVTFGVQEDENGETGDKVMSFDVVPAFTLDDYYEIPDTATSSGWTKTNPKVHFDKAVAAQEAYNNEWKGLVRMMKAWNRTQGKPIKPSFLIEVMALEVLYPPFGGIYAREMQAFFATLAARIQEEWRDPAGLGPNVSDSMDSGMRAAARAALLAAEKQAAEAIHLERTGSNERALRKWKEMFGKLFPLS
jgi:Second Messenger Oligonucleotide or Dinucleotide Synthetase domain